MRVVINFTLNNMMLIAYLYFLILGVIILVKFSRLKHPEIRQLSIPETVFGKDLHDEAGFALVHSSTYPNITIKFL